MNALVVLIDANVLLDFLTDRDPFSKTAREIMQRSQEKTVRAFLAAHSITNIFYILRKIYSSSERKQRLLDLCRIISVVEIGYDIICNALENTEYDDIEDCLQAECARQVNADYIITRNTKDYFHSAIPAILPEDLLKKLEF